MRRIILALLLLAATGTSLAARSVSQCRDEYPGEDAQHRQERLKCYDETVAATTALLTATPASGARLWDAWRLSEHDIPLGAPQLYHPIYFIARHSDNLNHAPSSPAHPLSPSLNLRRTEAKFQLSFKSEIVSPDTFEHFLNTDRFRLWLGYTQQSNWQILDVNDSRPFRNSNYTPELILTTRLGKKEDSSSLVPVLLNIGLWEHQSNGQSDPLSRSWNRSYVQGGWQLAENTSLLVRVWQRWSEDPLSDDNRDIVSYMGRWDVLVRRDLGRTRASLLLRGRFMQFDWGVPVGSSQFHAQITSGYGESLLDYNHRQTTVGIGYSFGAW